MTPPVSTSTVALLSRILASPFSRLQLIVRPLSTTRSHNMTKTFKVAQVTELQDGQMKEVDIPGTEGKVLLSKVKGEFYATGAKCTRTPSPCSWWADGEIMVRR